MAESPRQPWAAISCGHCDFSAGTRGMDRCVRCDGTGSQLIIRVTGERFPNTEAGWKRLEARLADLALAERAGHGESGG